jgi:non-specific serine/threonine protein kinase/serine/threonine-protein kinase
LNDDPKDLESTELPPTASASPPSGETPREIGPYRLLQKLGEGGMGEVWLAEQTEPVKRRVALKVIKQGMDTKQVVARFEAERQALAMMDHPAVAKVFDAGATPEGRPYFAMEYVKGVPVTAHCDRHKLGNRERLDLFMQVCEGVQHAHQKAIIHRDLKPSNVLVSIQDGKAVPKIIDFGVAKATAQKLTEKTMFTQLGVLIGTPEYMSPEQAELTGQDVDTRTDVYSLGVMLYELLVGALPFDSKELRSGGFDAIRRKIREEDPPRPSTRLSTLGDRSTESAKLRRLDLPALQRQLRGDLDWITMKALENLAADVERYLRHEPVLASPPSAVYRARKFVRRHRLGVAAGAVVTAALLLGIAGTTVGLVRAVRAERRATVEAETATQVSGFLTGLFQEVDPARSRGETITLREVLDQASEKIEEELADEPIVQARLMHVMGRTYYAISLSAEAVRFLERALAIRREALGRDHPDSMETMEWLADAYHWNAQDPECRAMYTELFEARRRVLGPEHPDTLFARLELIERNDIVSPEAEPALLETLATLRRVAGSDAYATRTAIRALGDH